MVYDTDVTLFEGENERRNALRYAGADDVLKLTASQSCAARQLPGIRMPDHHAVLVDLRQCEAMTFENRARAMQRATGGDRVSDIALVQQPQRLTCVLRDLRVSVKKRAIEIEYDKFHAQQFCSLYIMLSSSIMRMKPPSNENVARSA